ncbi:MAG: hypothetical protein GY711_08995 [bacterium]|nr:hypothetical protein [bacterium]
MITRKIGRLLRGKSTPFQVTAACILASWLAFVPGFAQAPGWIATLVALLLVLNANLGLALLVLAPARLAFVALVPTTFEVGRFLLDGPTRGAFAAAAGAPGLAWFGLEHYLTTGGIAVGFAFGLATGVLLNLALGAFRRKMASVENDSERYQELMAKKWVRVLCFVFVGGKRKKSYEELARKRAGNPVRLAGVALVTAAVVGGFAVRGLLAEPLVTAAVHDELVRANGATVDLDSVAFDLAGGRLTIEGLALCDRDELTTDVFRAQTLEADLDVGALLRRRFTIERLVVREARHGAPRATPGELTTPATPSADETRPEEETRGDERTLEDYIDEAKLWKERLAKARGHIERVWGSRDDSSSPEPADDRPTERARTIGHAHVISEGLVADAPALTIQALTIEGLRIDDLPSRIFDLEARNLSTHPSRLAAAPRIDARSRSGQIELTLDAGAPAGAGLHMRVTDLDAAGIARSLRVDGQPVIEDGRIDLTLDGGWAGGNVGMLDLPLEVTLRDATIVVPSQGAQPVDTLAFAVGVRGPLDAPRLRVDADELRQSLVEAGKARLRAEAERLEAEARAEVERVRAQALAKADRLKAEAAAEADELAQEGKELVDEGKREARSKLESETKKAVGKKLTGRLGGLLSRKKKD